MPAILSDLVEMTCDCWEIASECSLAISSTVKQVITLVREATSRLTCARLLTITWREKGYSTA